MTEAEYVRATALDRTRTCMTLIHKILPGPEVLPEEHLQVMRILGAWEKRLEVVIKTDDTDPYPALP